jgi:hypothetical protein
MASPITSLLGIGAAGLSLAGSAVSAKGTLAAGQQQQYAGFLAAQSALQGSELIASGQEGAGALQADYYRRSGDIAARTALGGSELAARTAEIGSDI